MGMCGDENSRLLSSRLAADLIRDMALRLFYQLTFQIPSTLHPLDAALVLSEVQVYLEREEDAMLRIAEAQDARHNKLSSE